MTYAEIWNFIVKEYHSLSNEKEEKVDNRWQTYCSELFGYKKLLGEVVSQTSIHVGSHDHAIPDILLSIDGTNVFDIELKQYNLAWQKSFEEQLISYLKLTHISVGMIVCKKIYLYSYEYSTDKVDKIEIPFEKDNADGIKLMDLLTRDSFSAQDITAFVRSKKQEESDIRDILETLTPQNVTQIVTDSLTDRYPAETIRKALQEVEIIIVKKGEIPPDKIDPTSPHPNSGRVEWIKDWCKQAQENGRLVWDPGKSVNTYIRFTTAKLDSLIPTVPFLKSGWGNDHFYYYEIENRAETVRMKLSLNHVDGLPLQIETAFQQIGRKFRVQFANGWQWKTVFSSKSIKPSDDKQTFMAQLTTAFNELMEKENQL